jgi:hypothetical protein
MVKISDFLKDLVGIIDAFVDEFDKTLSPNLYGSDGVLDESDVDILRIFSLFKNPETLLQEFIAYNKKFYRQDFTDPNIFIKEYFKASSYTKLHETTYEKKQFVYLFGIPVLVVNHLPWDQPDDDIVLHGCYNTVGIVCRESNEVIDTLLHELAHAMNRWLKTKGKFKLPKSKVKKVSTTSKDPLIQQLYSVVNLLVEKAIPDSVDTVMTRFRDEVIAYLIASPGTLSKSNSEIAMRSLAGIYRAKACTYFGENIVELDAILDFVIRVDRSTSEMHKRKLSLIMYPSTTTSEIIDAINTTFAN